MIPRVGAWTADLQLAGAQAVSGAVPVVIGNLTLLGTVVRSTQYGGQTRARLVGGYGGWRMSVSEQGYGGGVLLSHVLSDVAAACGEQVAPTTGLVGSAWTRLQGPASDTLWQLLGQGLLPGWYVAPNGVTVPSTWPATTINTPFTVTDQAPDEGRCTIATEDYASWLPGASFTSPLTVGTLVNAGVTYTFDNAGDFRLDVLTGTTDRLLGPLRAFVDSRVAPTRFYGRYAYTVTAATTSAVDGTPVDASVGIPDLKGVPLTGDSISSYLPTPGSTCHVQFVDGQPDNPVCVWTSGPPMTVAIGLDPSGNPIALATPTLSAIAAIAGVLAALGTLLVTPPTSTTFPLFATPAGAALNALAATLAPITVLIPTKTVTAGP